MNGYVLALDQGTTSSRAIIFDRMGNARQLHVSVFGSARTPKDSKYYNEAVEVGKQLVNAGYGVITGGGPGIMEAASKGAFEEIGVLQK